MTETRQEMVEHTVDIDKYMSVSLNIPKRMSALDLKAITSKANKMFNLAEVPLVETGLEKNRLSRTLWTPKQEEQLIYFLKEGQTNRVIAKHFGMTTSQIASKKYKLKNEGLLNQ